MSEQTLRNWVFAAQVDAGERKALGTDEREELRLLRRRVKVHEQEREIPQKAAAWFAKETTRVDPIRVFEFVEANQAVFPSPSCAASWASPPAATTTRASVHRRPAPPPMRSSLNRSASGVAIQCCRRRLGHTTDRRCAASLWGSIGSCGRRSGRAAASEGEAGGGLRPWGVWPHTVERRPSTAPLGMRLVVAEGDATVGEDEVDWELLARVLDDDALRRLALPPPS